MLRNFVTDICLLIISKINKHKDRCLAARLYGMSLSYDPLWIGGNKMDNEQYDEMLQDMTLALREIYENATDKFLDEREAASLNDTLDVFFGTKMG